MADGGIVEGVKVDVVRLHETWMELLFPRQRTAVHRVLGKWKPRTRADEIKYYGWGGLGVPVVALLYPLLVVGFAVRFNARRFDSASTRLGLVGVVVLAALVWGLLTALARIRLSPDGGRGRPPGIDGSQIIGTWRSESAVATMTATHFGRSVRARERRRRSRGVGGGNAPP